MNLQQQRASEDSKRKLDAVRAKQQLAYSKEALALKSNDAAANSVVNLPTKVALTIRTNSPTAKPSVNLAAKEVLTVKNGHRKANSTDNYASKLARAEAVATPSNAFPKAPMKKRWPCRRYHSLSGLSGCHQENCQYLHEDLPSKEPEKLIDDTVPGEVLQISNPIPFKPNNPHKIKNPIAVKVAEPTKSGEPVELPPIVWAGNTSLSNLSFCINSLWQIFGTREPTKKQAIEWCQKMNSDGHFKHFTNRELVNWSKAIGLGTTEDFCIFIGSLPGISQRFDHMTQLEFKKLRAAYDAEEARPKYDTFHCFGRLPNELAVKIWGFAHQAGRELRVTLNRKPILSRKGPGIFVRHSPPSPLWYTCKQSMEACMLDTQCAYYFGCDYFAPNVDTLFFDTSPEYLHRFKDQVRLWRGKVVQRLSLHYHLVRTTILNMETFANDLLTAFPGIIRLELLLADTEYNAKYIGGTTQLIEMLDKAVSHAYNHRAGGKDVPRVRLMMIPEARAKEMGINYGFW